MNRIDFSLNPSPTAPMAELPVGSELMLWVANYSVDAARGKKVVRGTRIATHKEPAGGLLCAPCAGKVADVDVGYVRMTVADQGEAGESVEPISVASYSGGDEFARYPGGYGVSTHARCFLQTCSSSTGTQPGTGCFRLQPALRGLPPNPGSRPAQSPRRVVGSFELRIRLA